MKETVIDVTNSQLPTPNGLEPENCFKWYGGITQSSFAGKFDNEVGVNIFGKRNHDNIEDSHDNFQKLRELVELFKV